MGIDQSHDLAVLNLMCALQELDLLPMRATTEAGLSRLKQSAVKPGTGSDFVAVYRSTALDLRDAELRKLVAHSSANNARLDISGILLRYDIYFLQVLEGEERSVRDLLERIGRDRRHTRMEILFTQQHHQRVFRDWSMELVDVSPQDFESMLSRLSNDGSLSERVFSAMRSGASTSSACRST